MLLLHARAGEQDGALVGRAQQVLAGGQRQAAAGLRPVQHTQLE